VSQRVTVNFFHVDNDSSVPNWALFDAAGYVPEVGDFIITPSHSHWTVTARTWQQKSLTEIDCNLVVEDLASIPSESRSNP
jgi:hypothetical protein